MPTITVLAGVNGAGKSSLVGGILHERGKDWFNPDAYALRLVQIGHDQDAANSIAWAMGKARLMHAIDKVRDHAFETTLGGSTLTALLRKAMATHYVAVWFCGLESAELHIERVAQRAAGGHDVPPDLIRFRYDRSRENLISLMDGLAALRVYDNSACTEDGARSLKLVLNLHEGIIAFPASSEDLHGTPEWAMPIVQHALQLYPPAWLRLSVLSILWRCFAPKGQTENIDSNRTPPKGGVLLSGASHAGRGSTVLSACCRKARPVRLRHPVRRGCAAVCRTSAWACCAWWPPGSRTSSAPLRRS